MVHRLLRQRMKKKSLTALSLRKEDTEALRMFLKVLLVISKVPIDLDLDAKLLLKHFQLI